ncbi:MAG: hypothetical protein HY289_04215 [Planctomycetes bacterium]|nr:hypothetical protein [Planctomycetota bacterium]
MRPACAAFIFAGSLLLAGCSGERHVHIAGTLLEGGQPLQPKENEEVTITFVAINPHAKVQIGNAEFEPSASSFTVHGPLNDGIPPGEYRIVVRCTPYQEDEPDRFAGAFSEEKTPLRYTVTHDRSQEIVVDLKARTVTNK